MIDRPAWAALSTSHLALSVGNARARRYRPDVNLFASCCDDTPDSAAALADLARPGEQLYVLQVPAIVVPAGFTVIHEATGVQMVASRPIRPDDESDDIVELADADAPDMLALATLTQPGPFLAGTHRMGRFLGIRRHGRLVAMAGERFRFPGFTEISGVCVHPEYRGLGLARRLSAAITSFIEARGDRPFLHAWKTNRPAISLYGSLGFEFRTEVNVKILARTENTDPVR